MTLDRALHALGDGTRRRIVERLRDGPRSVASIAAGLPVSRPAVSQHLKLLHEAGLVAVEPRGASRLYRLDPSGFAGLQRWLDGLWTPALDRFKLAAEAAEKEETP